MSMRSSNGTDLTPSDSSGGGDGIGVPCPLSLTEEKHVQNLRSNCRRAFGLRYPLEDWADIQDHQWFVRVVVTVLRVDYCLDNSIVEIGEVPFYLQGVRLLHLAVLMGHLEMVQKILQTRLVPNEVHIDSIITWERGMYSALGLAIVGGENEIVDALLEKNAEVNTLDPSSSLHLAVFFARAKEPHKTSAILQSLVRKGIDITAKDGWGYSAFYLAVALGKTDTVLELLLNWKDKIQLNEACRGGRLPIQIAIQEGFKEIENALRKCDDVKWYIDSTLRMRQGYVDTANAILVGAAFIASATFASWLQPPLNYTTSYRDSSVEYVDLEHNIALGIFWVFNSLSFYFAIGTVVLGTVSVLPKRDLFITENVEKLSKNLILMSILLAFSMFCVVIAFGIAGFIVLVPVLRYWWYMIAPTILGGIVCVGSIGYLVKSLWEHKPWNIRSRKRICEANDIKFYYGS